MAGITRIEKIGHEQLPGVAVYMLERQNAAPPTQEVLVEVGRDGHIPLHSHTVDATMIILDGAATVLSEDLELNGRRVSRGDVVFFEKDRKHGFKASDTGLLFLSRNGGIVGNHGEAWDIDFGN